jgi:hypothetical protein
MVQIPNSRNSNNNNSNQNKYGNNISDSQKANELNPFFAPKNKNHVTSFIFHASSIYIQVVSQSHV